MLNKKDVLSILQLRDDKGGKKIATSSMISTFNNCQFNRRKDIYLNVQLVTSFSKTDHDGVEESIQPQEGTEIHKIKLEMKIISEKVNYWREELHKLLMEKNPDVHYL